jgi:hypothetical protein
LIQFDGMRHVFILVPALAIVGAIGLDYCFTRLAEGVAGRQLARVSSSVCLVWLLIECIRPHPYQGSYLNEAVRALVPWGKLDEYFDIASWGSPLCDGVKWLNQHAPAGALVRVVPGDSPEALLSSYQLRGDLRVAYPDNPEPADFTITARREFFPPSKRRPVFSVTCFGTSLLTIYPGDIDNR